MPKRGLQSRGYLPAEPILFNSEDFGYFFGTDPADPRVGRGFLAARSRAINLTPAQGQPYHDPADPKFHPVKIWDRTTTIRYGPSTYRYGTTANPQFYQRLGTEQPTSVAGKYVPAVGPGTAHALGLTPAQYLELLWRVEEIKLTAGTGGMASSQTPGYTVSGSRWEEREDDPGEYDSVATTYPVAAVNAAATFPTDIHAAAGGDFPARLSRAPVRIERPTSYRRFTRLPRAEAWLPLSPPLWSVLDGRDHPSGYDLEGRDWLAFENFQAFDAEDQLVRSGVEGDMGALPFSQRFDRSNSWFDHFYFVEGKFWLTTPVRIFSSAKANPSSSKRETAGEATDTVDSSAGHTTYLELVAGNRFRQSNSGADAVIAEQTMDIRYEHRPGKYVVGKFIVHEGEYADDPEFQLKQTGPNPPALPTPTLAVALPEHLTITPVKWFTYGGIYNEDTGERETGESP